MKKLLILVLVVLLASVALTACGDDDKDDKKESASPVDTVRDYFNAFSAKDTEKAQSLTCADADASVLVDPAILEAIESIRIEDAQYNEVSQDDTTAVVHFQGNMIAVIAGTDNPSPTDQNITLKKIDGKWCLFSSADAAAGS